MSLGERIRRSTELDTNQRIMKVVVAGPKGSGKSLISNFIAGQTEKISSENYSPTSGVRILEFESKVSHESVNIELWDASGDHSYESCWRTIMADVDAVLLIYNPDAPSQDQQLGDWFEYFVRKNGLKDEQCMIFAHRGDKSTNERFKPPPLFSRVTAALTTAQSGPDIRNMFDTFIRDVYSIKQRK